MRNARAHKWSGPTVHSSTVALLFPLGFSRKLKDKEKKLLRAKIFASGTNQKYAITMNAHICIGM